MINGMNVLKNFSRILKNQFFWSNLVKREYELKFSEISDEIGYFLDVVENILENNENDFDYYLEFENLIINQTRNVPLDSIKKHKILEHFWNDHVEVNIVHDELLNSFKRFNSNFNKIYFMRDKKLNKYMRLHNCGVDNYLKYLKFAKQLYEWGVHAPDCKIIMDAHDCGFKYDDLIFISNDEVMIDVLNNHDASHLNILEFKSCN